MRTLRQFLRVVNVTVSGASGTPSSLWDTATLGADYFVRRDRTKLVKRLVHRLNDLGVRVTVEPAA